MLERCFRIAAPRLQATQRAAGAVLMNMPAIYRSQPQPDGGNWR